MAAIATTDNGVQFRLDLVDRMPRGAFGYFPQQWPASKMFGSPVSPQQVKMVGVYARKRRIDAEDLPVLRALVLNAYGVGDANSKGNAALFIDWMKNSDEDSIDEALGAARASGIVDQRSLFSVDAA